MQKNASGQRWVIFAFGRTSGSPVTGDAANITANLRLDGGSANPIDDTNPQELEGGYYYFDLTNAETNGDLIAICPVSATANVIVIGVPGAVFTEPAGQKYPATLATADVTGNLPAQVKAQDDIDFGATQKASITAAVPTAAAAGTDAASKVLATPANKLVTDTSGRVDLVSAPNATAVTAIQAGLATPTNITAGTITTVTNLTNAPTVGDLTATMKASVTAAVPSTDAINAACDTAISDAGLATPSQVNAELVDVLRTDLIPDSVAVDGNSPTLAQAIYMILQFLTEKSVTGTTLTVKKPDGSTALMTFTLNDSAIPTSITRAT